MQTMAIDLTDCLKRLPKCLSPFHFTAVNFTDP
jgi:hypothetical protein